MIIEWKIQVCNVLEHAPYAPSMNNQFGYEILSYGMLT